MTIKLTMLFQEATNVSNPLAVQRRIGGWSESWYFAGDSLQNALDAANKQGGFIGQPFPGLFPARAALLPQGAGIIGFRVQKVDPPGPVQTGALNYPGIVSVKADVPQMALLLRVPGAGVRNIRRTILRGIPDDQVVEGEFAPTPAYSAALAQFVLALGAWQFRGRDLSQAVGKILTVDANGNVVAEAGLPFALQQMVRVLKTQVQDESLKGGRFQIETTGPATNQVKLRNWTLGPATGGSIRADGIVYVNVDSANTGVSRVITRRVGRPFGGYRGRRAKTRK